MESSVVKQQDKGSCQKKEKKKKRMLQKTEVSPVEENRIIKPGSEIWKAQIGRLWNAWNTIRSKSWNAFKLVISNVSEAGSLPENL